MADATYAMQQVVNAGSGKTALSLGRPVAAKTGSSSDNKSAQFVGYTPQVATAVTLYQAGEDGTEESITPWGEYEEITGSTYPADIFTDYMTTALKDLPVEDFPDRTPGSYQRGSLNGTPMPVDDDYNTPEPQQPTAAPTTAPQPVAPSEEPGQPEPSYGNGDQPDPGVGQPIQPTQQPPIQTQNPIPNPNPLPPDNGGNNPPDPPRQGEQQLGNKNGQQQ